MHKSFHLGKYEVQGRLGFESCYFHVLRDLRLLNLVAICKGWKKHLATAVVLLMEALFKASALITLSKQRLPERKNIDL